MDRLVAGNCAPSVPKRTNVCCLEPRSQSALNFRGVTLDPPPDGDVVGVQALLGQQLFFNAPLRLPDSDGLDGVFSPDGPRYDHEHRRSTGFRQA